MDEMKPYNTELKINVQSDVTQEELAEYIKKQRKAAHGA